MRKRSSYKSKGTNPDPLRAAMAMSAYMTDAERKLIVPPMVEARDALGHNFDLHYWRDLADACNVAIELKARGIATGPNAEEIFGNFHSALTSLDARFRDRGTWTPWAQEIEAIRDGVNLHVFQLKHCSMRQFRDAWEALVRKGDNVELRGHAADVARARAQARLKGAVAA